LINHGGQGLGDPQSLESIMQRHQCGAPARVGRLLPGGPLLSPSKTQVLPPRLLQRSLANDSRVVHQGIDMMVSLERRLWRRPLDSALRNMRKPDILRLLRSWLFMARASKRSHLRCLSVSALQHPPRNNALQVHRKVLKLHQGQRDLPQRLRRTPHRKNVSLGAQQDRLTISKQAQLLHLLASTLRSRANPGVLPQCKDLRLSSPHRRPLLLTMSHLRRRLVGQSHKRRPL
jgi:hypothetical protein